MEIGQRVYVQKNELQFHKWYKAYIVEIRRQTTPMTNFSVFQCLTSVLPCCSTLPMEYVVRYEDGNTQIVTVDRIIERFHD